MRAPCNLSGDLGDIGEVRVTTPRSSDARSTAPPISFDRLYEEQRPRLLRLARLLVGSAAIAEEVVQDAFVVLCTTEQVVANPAGYLRGTVIHLCLKTRRRREVERAHLARAQPTAVLPPELDETWAVICALPMDQRTVIVLRFYEDASLQEIADLTGRPLGTIKSLLHRSLARLSRELTQP